MRVMAVVQFGLAIMPLCHFTSAALISGITSGTESSMRNALELSMTTQPARAARGANSFEMLPPALNNARSMPLNDSFVSSATAISSRRNLSVLPTERAEASRDNRPAGKLRFSSVLIISTPTAPVAPTTATCGLRFIKRAGSIATGWRLSTGGTGLPGYRVTGLPRFVPLSVGFVKKHRSGVADVQRIHTRMHGDGGRLVANVQHVNRKAVPFAAENHAAIRREFGFPQRSFPGIRMRRNAAHTPRAQFPQ